MVDWTCVSIRFIFFLLFLLKIVTQAQVVIDFISPVSVSADNQTIECKLKVFELEIEIDQLPF